MKCLITGANGFVGSHLIEYILENHPNYEVWGMYRSHTSSFDNVEHIRNPRLKWVQCDLLDPHSLNKIFKENIFDKVFHLAAQSAVPTSYTSPAHTLSVNGIGTINLLEAIREYNPNTIVYICSSSEVYGHNVEIPTKETSPYNPLSPYALSKVTEELAAQIYNKCYGLKTITSRAFTHSGPRRGDLFFTSAFSKQIAKIEAGLQEPIIKVGNLESHRTIMHIKDCVKAYWLLTEKGVYGEIYNIGGKETWKVGDALNYMISLSPIKDKIKVEVDKNLLRPRDVNMQIPDTTKFKLQTGWEVEIPVTKVFEDILKYWRGKFNVINS